MKKYYYILFLVSIIANSQVINFPDTNLRDLLLQANPFSGGAIGFYGNQVTIDINTNGEIEQSEALLIYGLYIGGSLISNLSGLEYFTNLQRLSCTGSSITTINLAPFPNLIYLQLNNNSLMTLDLSSNVSLIQVQLSSNQLTSLNITGLINLTALFYNYNQLPNLDVSSLTNLRRLDCQGNQITSLNISTLTQLEGLNCGDNLLTSLNISGLPLKELSFDNNQISAINIAGQISTLRRLYCDNNQLTALNLAGFSQLRGLTCNNNQIVALNLNNSFLLDNLFCAGNNLSFLSIQNNANALLNDIYRPITDDYLIRFDATNNPNLTCIFVSDVNNCNYNWPSKDATSTYVSTQAQCNVALTNEKFEKNLTSVFPNPNRGFFTISGLADNSQIAIYDILGKKVHEQNLLNNQQIQLQNFAKGIYFAKIKTGDIVIKTQKIIIE